VIVADSDVLIDALRGREPFESRIAEVLAADALATTAVSAFELLSGAKTEASSAKVRQLLAPLEILPVDAAASAAAAEARRYLGARGKTIGMADYLIAGVCLSRSLTLLTRNRKHFERVPGLVLG
jgi:tRNA(fMet)-specific endonuclease VapC